MKIKKQTRKLAAGCSKYSFEVVDRTDEVSLKHCFEVVDRTDEVSNIRTVRRRWRGLKRFSKSIKHKQKPPHQVEVISFINTILSRVGQLGRLGCMDYDEV